MIVKIFSFLLIVFPFTLVSGPFLTNLSVTLIGLYYIFSIKKSQAKELFDNIIVKLIIVFWFYCLIRSLFSINVSLSLESSLFYGRFIFFSLGVALLLHQNKKIILFFGISLWVCLTLLTLDGYLQFFTAKNILGWERFGENRISSFFGEELVLGGFLARLMPMAFFFISFNFKNKYFFIVIALSLLILQDILIFLAGERVAFFFLILGSLMIIFLLPKYRIMRIITFSISCFLIVLLTTQFTSVKERMIDKTLMGMGITDANQDILIINKAYQAHYSNGIKMFFDNPIIGHGPKMYRYLCSEFKIYSEGCSTHPHNTYVQLLAEVGLLGTLPVIILFFYVSFKLFRHFFSYVTKKDKFIINEGEICLLICFVITLWPAAPSANFFTSWINAIYYLPFGFYLYKTKN